MGRAFALVAGLSLASAGCFPHETTTRSQAAADLAEVEQFATVGSKTAVGNVDPIPVNGVGLVMNLNGTGSVPAADGWRTMLELALRRQKGAVKQVLDDPSRQQSLVLVSGVIPPGARAGDKFDLTVTLPQGSKTTSLRGGLLMPADLHNMELAATARQAMNAAGIPTDKVPSSPDNTLLTGHRMGAGEGFLIAGHDGAANDSGDGPRAGRVWGGGRCLINRPYHLMLNESSPQPRMALVIAERLNAVFHAPGDKQTKLAEAKVEGRQPIVATFVPPAYRLNHARFLVVARLVPLQEVAPDSPYRKQLENDLLRPEVAMVSAMKLEALGDGSRQALRVGLQSDSPWVKFASAEALAYLGHADGVKDLADLAAKHPAMRPQALTALASLDDAVSLDRLTDLMQKPEAQLRYGAFVALRSADEDHEAIRGHRVNHSYWLHSVAPNSDPMVHVTSERRAEIVMFGDHFPMRPPFTFSLGKDFTVTAKEGEVLASVNRVGPGKDGEPAMVTHKVPADLKAILGKLGELGAAYPEAVKFIRRAQETEVVTSAIWYDAAPRGFNLLQLAAISRNDPDVAKADAEVQRVGTADVVQTSYDAPTEADAVQAKPDLPAAAPALNRDPGRLFGPKRTPDASEQK